MNGATENDSLPETRMEVNLKKNVEKKATVHILYFIIYGWLIAKSSYFHTFYHHSFFIWEESLEF